MASLNDLEYEFLEKSIAGTLPGGGGETADNVVVINEEADFPVQDATTITIEDNTAYQIGSSFNTAKTFVMQGGEIYSEVASLISPSITYTGTGTLFSCNLNRGTLRNLSVDCTNGTVFEVIGDGTANPNYRINIDLLLVTDCVNLGDMTNAGAIVASTLQVVNFSGTYALQFSGTGGVIYSLIRCGIFGAPAGSTVIDFGNSTCNEIEIENGFFQGDASATAISGLIDSGNVTSGNLASITGTNVTSFTTPLNNISTEDFRWIFRDNAGIIDGITDALLSLQSSSTTTISAVNTPVKLDATWTVEQESQMDADTTGRATCLRESGVNLPVTALVNLEPISGSDVPLSIYIAKNGTEITNSRQQTSATNTKPQQVTAIWQDTLENGDYYEIFVENNDNDDNIIVNTAILRVN